MRQYKFTRSEQLNVLHVYSSRSTCQRLISCSPTGLLICKEKRLNSDQLWFYIAGSEIGTTKRFLENRGFNFKQSKPQYHLTMYSNVY